MEKGWRNGQVDRWGDGCRGGGKGYVLGDRRPEEQEMRQDKMEEEVEEETDGEIDEGMDGWMDGWGVGGDMEET